MRRLLQPCGLHCIKINDIGVSFGEQTVLEHVNLHIHCGNLAAVIDRRNWSYMQGMFVIKMRRESWWIMTLR